MIRVAMLTAIAYKVRKNRLTSWSWRWHV